MKNFIKKYLVNISMFLLFSLAASGCTSTSSQSDLHAKSKNVIQSKAELMTIAKNEENNNQFEKAIFNYIQVLEMDGKDTEILYKIGSLQNKLHNTDLAIRAFNKALEVDPDYIPALAQMGIYYLERKNMDKARSFLKRTVMLDQQRLHNTNVSTSFIELDQQSPLLAYNVYAVINDLDSRHEYAQKIFYLLLKTQKNSALVYTNLGYSFYLINNYTVAKNYYKKALDADSNFERAKLNLGLIYVRNGQYNKAVQLFKQVMTHAEAYNDIGYFLMLDGRYKEAEYFFQTAIEYSPSYFEKGNINLENVQIYLSAENTYDTALQPPL
ncbi:tetratricopeptide repeat protein [Colwellia sp. BRX10-3]|uniref:tetratricopeptide repeat protein n=1 Tax=Colwellia sp. BRX10-3 TaxID=2759844 RepID=UPI0015F784AB|nr:tetratricopeptide repeat protein [Colwellia sp. BRX10-3]MBA6390703.1 tetratricopeptide repeat protein [Colwellia sp. BRX10-3]